MNIIELVLFTGLVILETVGTIGLILCTIMAFLANPLAGIIVAILSAAIIWLVWSIIWDEIKYDA